MVDVVPDTEAVEYAGVSSGCWAPALVAKTHANNKQRVLIEFSK